MPRHTQFLPHPDGQIFVAHWPGDENLPPIVLLHEGLGCVARWKNWPQWLAEQTGAPVWAFDRLGHGQSAPLPQAREADYLHREAWQRLPDYLQQLGIRQPLFFGHSDGGSIALLYASRYVCSGIFSMAAHVLVEPITLAGIAQSRKSYPAWRARFAHYHGSKSDALFYAWADTWLSEEFRDWNMEQALSQIQCPCYCLQGAADDYGTPLQLQRMQAQNPRIQTHLLPQLRHQPHLEAPQQIQQHWKTFWQQLQP